jgi:hypothetical protein
MEFIVRLNELLVQVAKGACYSSQLNHSFTHHD